MVPNWRTAVHIRTPAHLYPDPGQINPKSPTHTGCERRASKPPPLFSMNLSHTGGAHTRRSRCVSAFRRPFTHRTARRYTDVPFPASPRGESVFCFCFCFFTTAVQKLTATRQSAVSCCRWVALHVRRVDAVLLREAACMWGFIEIRSKKATASL